MIYLHTKLNRRSELFTNNAEIRKLPASRLNSGMICNIQNKNIGAIFDEYILAFLLTVMLVIYNVYDTMCTLIKQFA